MKVLSPTREISPGSDAYFDWLENWLNIAGLEQTMNPQRSDYQCAACGCLFITSTYSAVTYLDRYQHADDNAGCDCHSIPRVIPAGTGTITWYQQDMDLLWLCHAPLRTTARSHTCDQCSASPVVFLNFETTVGPRWLCAQHLGLPDTAVFDNWVPLESTTEPEGYRLAREAVETMLALQE